jgi:Secretion system C-terminal sorting domain
MPFQEAKHSQKFCSIVMVIDISTMTISIKTSPIILLFFAVCSSFITQAQITVTLGTGTSKTQGSPTGPSPYNTDYPARIMQFVYTAAEIKSAGGSQGEIQSIAWKVSDTTTTDMPDYGVWMKNTKAKDVSSHDNSGLKQVKNRHDYKHGKPGWQTMRLDSTFYWDGTSNVLIQVCFGTISTTSSRGTVFIYNNVSNQRRGEVGKSSICGTTSTTAYNWKPFIQFVIVPDCVEPGGITASNVTSSGAEIKWKQSASKSKGYEYVVAQSSGTPTTKGTFTTDTFFSVKGLCPSKLNFFYIRTVCSASDTSDWSRAFIFQTKAGGSISTNSPICVGDSLKLSVESAKDYSWTGPFGFTSTDQILVFADAQKSRSGNYSVAITDVNNCKVTYAASIKVDTLPVAKFTTNSPLCELDDLTIFADGGSTYSWTGPNGFKSDTNSFMVTKSNSSDQGFYVVQLANSFGCESMDSVEIEVNENPSFSSSSNTPVCVSDSIMFGATGSYDYLWWGPKGFLSIAQNPLIANSTTANAGVYVVQASTKEGCTLNDTAEVVVNTLPDVSISGNADVCDGSSLRFEASGAESFSWNKDGGFISDSSVIWVQASSSVNAGTYRLTGTDSKGCSKWDEKVVVIMPLPTANISVTDSTCEGEALSLSAETDGVNSKWTGPAGLSSTDLKTSIMAELKHNGIFRFTTSSSSNGCVLELSEVAVVLAKPVITLVSQGNNILASSGYDSYTWFLDGKEIKQGSSRILTADTIGIYSVEVTGSNGCMAHSNDVELKSLGINDVDISQLKVFPNPVEGIVQIESNSKIDMIVIFDGLGRKLITNEVGNTSISMDVTDLPSGQYIMQVYTENSVVYRVLTKY